MAKRRFWNGFAAGAAAGAAAGIASSLLVNKFGRAKEPRILRMEKSLQVGRPVEEVFRAWSDLERLPEWLTFVKEVRRDGNRSHWRVAINGREIEWDAEIEQFIPNQSIGWKSTTGPKHTGRITFSPLRDHTLVQVTMNYAPPLGNFSGVLEPISGYLEHYIERAFRDFKAAMEGKGREGAEAMPATGTFGQAGIGAAEPASIDMSGHQRTFGRGD